MGARQIVNLKCMYWILPALLCAVCSAARGESEGEGNRDGAAELRRKAAETMADAVSLHVEAQWESVKNGIRNTLVWSVDVRKARGQPWPIELREEGRDATSYFVRVPGKTYTEIGGDKLLLIENRGDPEFFSSVNQILGFFEALQEPVWEVKRERLPDVILNGEECAVFRRGEALAHHAKSDGCPRLIEWKDLTLRIQRVEFNVPIDPARFELKPPEGARIVVQEPIKPDPYAQKPRKGQRGWTPAMDETPPPKKVVRLIEEF